jgi:hypothetical protein
MLASIFSADGGNERSRRICSGNFEGVHRAETAGQNARSGQGERFEVKSKKTNF